MTIMTTLREYKYRNGFGGKMRRFLIIWVILLPVLLEALTIEDAIKMALDNNPDMQTSLNDKEMAYADYRGTKGILYPQIDAVGEYKQKTTMLSDNQTVQYGMDEQKETSLAAGVQASQILFSSSVFLGLRAARVYTDLQNTNVGVTEDNVIFNTYEAFDSVLLAEELLAIQREALEVAVKHYNQVQVMYEQKLVSEYDLLNAELSVSRLEPDVTEAEKNVVLAKESLKDFIGWNEGELELEGEISFSQSGLLSLESAIEEGANSRGELKVVALSREMQEINYKNESLYFLPNIQASAGYTHYALSDKYGVEGDDFGDTYNWGISFQLPIFKGLTNHYEKKSARYAYKNALITEHDTRNKIELEITSAYKSYQASLQKLKAEEKNVNLAQKALNIAETRYQNSLGTQLEVSDSQLTWKSTKISYLNAVYKAKINWLNLMKAIGRDL